MITVPEMVTSVYLTFGECGTQGNSRSAHYVEKKLDDCRRELKRPEFYFYIKNKVLPELEDVFSNSRNEGWDSFNAQPIQIKTYLQAIKFLESLANGLRVPTVGAEPDGQITFEWYSSPHRVLSVSVGSDGYLHYAALIGSNKVYGSESFQGESPKIILDLIERITTV